MKYPNPNTTSRPTDQYQPGKSWFYEFDEFLTWIQTAQSTLQAELAITAVLQYTGGFVTVFHHKVPTDSCSHTDSYSQPSVHGVLGIILAMRISSARATPHQIKKSVLTPMYCLQSAKIEHLPHTAAIGQHEGLCF